MLFYYSRNITILGCFDVINKEIVQIGKARHMKTCEDFGKIMNADSRSLKRHYKERNYVSMSPDILYRCKHPKWQRNRHLCTELHSHAPRAWSMHPEHGHAPQAWPWRPKGAFSALSCSLSMSKNGSELIFATFKWQKPGFLAQLQVETLPINTKPFIHNFSFTMKRFKRKANTRNFKGGVSLLTPSL